MKFTLFLGAFFGLVALNLAQNEFFRQNRRHMKQLLRRKSFRKRILSNKLTSEPENLPKRPNIVLLMTDDQDTELGSLLFMPKLNKYLKEQGKFKDIFHLVPF